MSLSLTAELRARVSTPPPFLAPTTPGAELSAQRSFEAAIQRLEATYGPPRRRVSVRAA